MRQWRVGTLSMGLSLIIMGVILFMTGANSREFTDLLLAWWPIVLIILGIEILFYFFLSKKENSTIKYDVFSIFFVGLIGSICIGFTLLTSIGLVEEIRDTLHTVEKTVDLPEVNQQIDSSITRIVVEKGYKEIAIEKTKDSEMLFFGTYRSTVSKDNDEGSIEMTEGKDIITTHVSGDTLYVSIKDLPRERGFDSYYPQMTATLVLPDRVEVSMLENGQPIAMQ